MGKDVGQLLGVFHLDDYALSGPELEVLEDIARIEDDGFLWFEGEKVSARKYGSFNACEILLYWASPDNFGVQRIRIGSTKPLTRLGWRKRLSDQRGDMRFIKSVVTIRQRQVREAFPYESITFKTIGWRLLNIKFFNPKSALKIKAAPDTRVTQVHTNAKGHLLTTLEKIPNGKA